MSAASEFHNFYSYSLQSTDNGLGPQFREVHLDRKLRNESGKSTSHNKEKSENDEFSPALHSQRKSRVFE